MSGLWVDLEESQGPFSKNGNADRRSDRYARVCAVGSGDDGARAFQGTWSRELWPVRESAAWRGWWWNYGEQFTPG